MIKKKNQIKMENDDYAGDKENILKLYLFI